MIEYDSGFQTPDRKRRMSALNVLELRSRSIRRKSEKRPARSSPQTNVVRENSSIDISSELCFENENSDILNSSHEISTSQLSSEHSHAQHIYRSVDLHTTDLISYRAVFNILNYSYEKVIETLGFQYLRNRIYWIESTPTTDYTYARGIGYDCTSSDHDLPEPNLARNRLRRNLTTYHPVSYLTSFYLKILSVLYYFRESTISLFSSIPEGMGRETLQRSPYSLRSGRKTVHNRISESPQFNSSFGNGSVINRRQRNPPEPRTFQHGDYNNEGDCTTFSLSQVGSQANEEWVQDQSGTPLKDESMDDDDGETGVRVPAGFLCCWLPLFLLLALSGTFLASFIPFYAVANNTTDFCSVYKKCCTNPVIDYSVLYTLIAEQTDTLRNDFSASREEIAKLREDILQEKFDRLQESSKLMNIFENYKIQINALKESQALSFNGAGAGVSEDDVKSIVLSQLYRYDADKTAMPDYALENSGAEVVSVRCTELVKNTMKIYWMLFVPYYWEYTGHPRNALQTDMNPGSCFAFNGFPGTLVIKLAKPIKLTAVSIEHIPKSVAPDGNINAAPKEFEVYGLRSVRDVEEPELLLSAEFDGNGLPLQTFDVTKDKSTGTSYGLVELRILSNHGNANHTCLYRVRVHGIPAL